MIITQKAWTDYITKLRTMSDKAAEDMMEFMTRNRMIMGSHLNPNLSQAAMQDLVDYAYAIATKYGEGTGALAAEMYDAIAALSGASVPAAIPAETATYGEVAKAVYGTRLQSSDIQTISDSVGRLVKMVGVDTMQQNALRDGAEWAWIPSGDTCAFCLTLASRGWQKASRKAIRNGHAEHVHANCDCTYAIRFNDNVDVQGYDPDKYLAMYNDAEGSTPEEKINTMRREFYAENREAINAQKRSAYAKRKEIESSAAEETNV